MFPTDLVVYVSTTSFYFNHFGLARSLAHVSNTRPPPTHLQKYIFAMLCLKMAIYS